MRAAGHPSWRDKTTVLCAAVLILLGPQAAAQEQTDLDRSDPALLQYDLEGLEEPGDRRSVRLRIEPSDRQRLVTDLAPFLVGAVQVDGAVELEPAIFAPAIEPFLGRELGAAELERLAGNIAAAARDAGFGLASAWVPRQDVTSGILRVMVDEGRIDLVETSGAAAPLVQARLARLVTGGPVRTADLERQLLLAEDVPGVRVRGARLEQRDGRNILVVATEFDRSRGRASIDNHGSSALGPVRARLSYELNGLIDMGDRVSVAISTTPLQPADYQFVRAIYSRPLGSEGTEVSVGGYAAYARPGGRSSTAEIEGSSYEVEVSLVHPLERSRDLSTWVGLDLALRETELNRTEMLARRDRLATASLSLLTSGRLGPGVARVRFAAVHGLDILGATETGAPLASREDAGGVFTKIEFSTAFTASLLGNLSLALDLEGQLAADALLSSEEFGLGGRRFLRAFEPRAVTGDHGLASAAELRFDLLRLSSPLRRIQFYAYADGGLVRNQGGRSGSLISAGGGLRLFLVHRLQANLEFAVPLTSERGEQRPPRLSVSVENRF
jgi:hemolysin activation/secretion protein